MSEEEKPAQESKQPPAEQANCGPCLRKVWRVFRWFLPVIALIYLSLVFREMWNADQGASHAFDRDVASILKGRECEKRIKHLASAEKKEKNPWLFIRNEQVSFYLETLEEKPECLALSILLRAPAGAAGGVNTVEYFYDSKTNLPVAKVTIEFINPRRR